MEYTNSETSDFIKYFSSAYKRKISPFKNPVTGEKAFVHIEMFKCLFPSVVPDTFHEEKKKKKKDSSQREFAFLKVKKKYKKPTQKTALS